MNEAADLLLEHLFRHQSGRMVAHLTRLLGPAYLDLAEETVQEAMLRALQTWPYQGMPENPAAWLFRVARNAAIDAVRRNRKMEPVADGLIETLSQPCDRVHDGAEFEEQLRDDELRMIFMCCHPELPRDARVALSLKTVGGFSVREIARAFMTDDQTVAQRLVRAKRQIRNREVQLEMPCGTGLHQRLDSAMEVVYFIFNEGYSAHEGEDLIRMDLCAEALRLGQRIAASSIAEPAVDALMALMTFQAARLSARTDPTGDLVLLEDQDCSQWDERMISIGFHYFDRSMRGDRVTGYHMQAAIAATYSRRAENRPVDWPVVLELYDRLYAMNPTAVVALNRAVAVAKVRGAADALRAIDPLAEERTLQQHYLFHAVRGHLLLELDRADEATECFDAALRCRCSEPERRFLRRKLEACADRQAHLAK